MKQRVELFKDILVPKRLYQQYDKAFKNNEGLSMEEIRAKIIRNLSVAAYRFSPQNDTHRYFFGKMQLVIKTVCFIPSCNTKKS